MVIKVDVEAGLRQLAAVKQRLEELLEWKKLALQELRPHQPPGFSAASSALRQIQADLHGVHLLFVSVANDIRQVLNRSDLACTAEDREHWQFRLKQLERSVRIMGLGLP